MKRKVRQSNFELLRIIAMLMIILHHFAGHGRVYDSVTQGGGKIVAALFFIGGSLGVNIFMLISSYFLIDTKFSLKRVLRIWFELFFYSVIFTVFGKIILKGTYNYEVWLRSFFPVTFNAAWFAVVYIFICFISPFMNRLIKCMDKKRYTAFISVLFISLVGMSVLTFSAPQRVLFNLGSWFVFMYFMAGYIKKFSIKILDNKFASMSVFIVSVASICTGLLLFKKLGADGSKFFQSRAYLPVNHESLFVFLASVSIFMFFKNINLGKNRVINFIAATAFDVYLIHDNNILRSHVWSKWVKTGTIDLTSWQDILIRGLVAAAAIYIVCSIIGRIRMICVERPIFSHLGRLEPFFKRIDSAFDFVDPESFDPDGSEHENRFSDDETSENTYIEPTETLVVDQPSDGDNEIVKPEDDQQSQTLLIHK